MSSKKIYIKEKKRRKEEFQFFMHDFIDACKKVEIASKSDLFPSYKWHVRAVLRELLIMVYGFIHKCCPSLLRRKEALIVPANGMTLMDEAFPYYGCYEIVPMLWDVWPYTWKRMYESFRLLDVKTVMVTSSQVAEMINQETNVRAYWIPEGINASLYHRGTDLGNRTIDVMEMGRQLPLYHQMLTLLNVNGQLHGYITSNVHQDGTLDDKHVAYTNEELRQLISCSKIMICFPQCDTNPSRGGNIETLTQRYWEAMLSRSVIVGRCPKELETLIGYDPVVNVDWDNPQQQLMDILEHIHQYQQLVDRNLETAQHYASWEMRMPLIRQYLHERDYGQ